jgi:hypothetical protein
MKYLALIALLWLTAGLGHADTFELSDPANEMLKEEQVAEEVPSTFGASKTSAGQLKNALCTVDTETGACSCIDQKQAKKLALTREECVSQVLRALQIQ